MKLILMYLNFKIKFSQTTKPTVFIIYCFYDTGERELVIRSRK